MQSPSPPAAIPPPPPIPDRPSMSSVTARQVFPPSQRVVDLVPPWPLSQSVFPPARDYDALHGFLLPSKSFLHRGDVTRCPSVIIRGPREQRRFQSLHLFQLSADFLLYAPAQPPPTPPPPPAATFFSFPPHRTLSHSLIRTTRLVPPPHPFLTRSGFFRNRIPPCLPPTPLPRFLPAVQRISVAPLSSVCCRIDARRLARLSPCFAPLSKCFTSFELELPLNFLLLD